MSKRVRPCLLLHTAERQPRRPHQLKEYLCGHLSKEAAWKFKLSAGVVELQQEAERQATGQSSLHSQCTASCPECSAPPEPVMHFLVQCPHYADPRAKLWEALHGIGAAAATGTQQLRKSNRHRRCWQTPCGRRRMGMPLQQRPSGSLCRSSRTISWQVAIRGFTFFPNKLYPCTPACSFLCLLVCPVSCKFAFMYQTVFDSHHVRAAGALESAHVCVCTYLLLRGYVSTCRLVVVTALC